MQDCHIFHVLFYKYTLATTHEMMFSIKDSHNILMSVDYSINFYIFVSNLVNNYIIFPYCIFILDPETDSF